MYLLKLNLYFQPVFEEEAATKKPAEKKVVKKKKKVPGKAGEEEEAPTKEKPAKDIPEITAADDKGRKLSKGTPVTIVKEATPEPGTRKDSLEPSGTGSRRGSASNLLSFTPPGGSRRGSITFIADEVFYLLVYIL